jgi:hypothetical protein
MRRRVDLERATRKHASSWSAYFGLLLVEGDRVTEYIRPTANEPSEKKLDEVKLALNGRPRY